mgnify:CR=1 FL=1
MGEHSFHLNGTNNVHVKAETERFINEDAHCPQNLKFEKFALSRPRKLIYSNACCPEARFSTLVQQIQ